ncbi:MAG: DUF480 domain-containing protein, partial [Burkholderiales bacterium]
LVLRGPQTAGELRINCERLHRFADISAVEAFLHELQSRHAGALVAELPRQPAARETRWASLLCGPVAPDALAQPAPEGVSPSDLPLGKLAALEANIARLGEEVETLKATVARLCGELGVKP